MAGGRRAYRCLGEGGAHVRQEACRRRAGSDVRPLTRVDRHDHLGRVGRGRGPASELAFKVAVDLDHGPR